MNNLRVIAHGQRYEGDPELVEYPIQRVERLAQMRKAREVRERINNTEWEEIEVDG